MTIAIDSNIFIYAEGINDAVRQAKALDLLEAIPAGLGVCPVQAYGELHRVLVRKGGRTNEGSRAAISRWREAFRPCETSVQAFDDALELAARHNFRIWDAVILAAASEAGCSVLLSEDMQHGFVWRGVTIVDPFRETLHPQLAAILRSGDVDR